MFKFHKREDEEALRFYQMPKVLFTSTRYKGLSLGAKAMYSVLRDRQELSKKNNWYDDDGNLYLIFTIESLCNLLDLSDKTITKYKRELNKYNLLKEKRQGQGKPNLLYIGKPNYEESDTYQQAETLANTKSRTFYDSRSEESTTLEAKNVRCNDTDLSDTEFIDTHSFNKEEKKNKTEGMTTKKIKSELLNRYDEDIVDKALIELKKQLKNGNNIVNTKNYLNALCQNMKQQIDITKSATIDNNRSYNNRFHNFEQRTDRYTEDEIEEIAKRKRREYMKELSL